MIVFGARAIKFSFVSLFSIRLILFLIFVIFFVRRVSLFFLLMRLVIGISSFVSSMIFVTEIGFLLSVGSTVIFFRRVRVCRKLRFLFTRRFVFAL